MGIDFENELFKIQLTITLGVDFMSKKDKSHSIEIGRGEIKDNALKALVTSPLFKAKVEKPKKGKGSYSRNEKHRGGESYPNVA